MEIAELPCMEFEMYDGKKMRIRMSENYCGILTIVDPEEGNQDYFFLKESDSFISYDGRGREIKAPNNQQSNKGEHMPAPIMKFFNYEHLPEPLQQISKPFGDLASLMDNMLPDGAEKSAGLRKLLEAKDCFVRAKL